MNRKTTIGVVVLTVMIGAGVITYIAKIEKKPDEVSDLKPQSESLYGDAISDFDLWPKHNLFDYEKKNSSQEEFAPSSGNKTYFQLFNNENFNESFLNQTLDLNDTFITGENFNVFVSKKINKNLVDNDERLLENIRKSSENFPLESDILGSIKSNKQKSEEILEEDDSVKHAYRDPIVDNNTSNASNKTLLNDKKTPEPGSTSSPQEETTSSYVESLRVDNPIAAQQQLIQVPVKKFSHNAVWRSCHALDRMFGICSKSQNPKYYKVSCHGLGSAIGVRGQTLCVLCRMLRYCGGRTSPFG